MYVDKIMAYKDTTTDMIPCCAKGGDHADSSLR